MHTIEDNDLRRLVRADLTGDPAAIAAACELRQRPIFIFGREMLQPRLTGWFGDPGATYRYSGVTNEPEPWPDCLLPLKQAAEEAVGRSFNSVLVNYYRDGKDSISWHSDDERDLGDDPVIASVTLGHERTFLVRDREKQLVESVQLGHGSIYVMKGGFQSAFQHSIPKEAYVRAPRLNLTFRSVAVP